MIPRKNNQIVAQGLARLTGAFQQPNIRAVLAVYLAPKQAMENTLWDVITKRVLATATVYAPWATRGPQSNIVFDQLGALVGLIRSVPPPPAQPSISDRAMKALIYLQIAVNRATGRTSDWSRFAAILAPWYDGVGYLDGDNADFNFWTWDLKLPPVVVASQLRKAPANGTYGCFMYSTWPDGGDFSFTSVYDGTAGELGFGSVYDSTVGGDLVASFSLAP